MNRIRALTICVDYDDLLRLSLPTVSFADSVLVVTTPDDERTISVAKSLGADIFETRVLYEHGAKFNKGLALELALDHLGRHGWLCIFDSDIVFPENATIPELAPECLYSAPRRILDDPRKFHPGFDWSLAEATVEAGGVYPGYFHLFHAADQHLKQPPWHDTTFCHAGGGDGAFQTAWPMSHKRYLPWEVLHLGPRDKNWFGRATFRMDGSRPDDMLLHAAQMKDYLFYRQKRWANKATKFNEHVDVPGHVPSGFDIDGLETHNLGPGKK